MASLSDQTGPTMAQILAMVDPMVASEVANAVPPAVQAALPIPTYRFNVTPGAIVVGTNVVAGVLIDRTAILSTMAYFMPTLVGVGVGLTVKVQKNGVDIPGASWSVVLNTFTELNIPGTIGVVKGNRVDIVFIGVGVTLAGSLFEAYVSTT